jgi:hypothetical protein
MNYYRARALAVQPNLLTLLRERKSGAIYNRMFVAQPLRLVVYFCDFARPLTAHVPQHLAPGHQVRHAQVRQGLQCKMGLLHMSSGNRQMQRRHWNRSCFLNTNRRLSTFVSYNASYDSCLAHNT